MSLNNPNFPSSLCAVRNRILVSVQADTNWESLEDYHVRLRIMEEVGYRSGTWQEYLTLRHYAPLSDRFVYFEISTLLEDLLQPDPPPANISDRLPQRLEQSSRRVRIELEEYVGGNLNSSPYTYTFHILRAGFNKYLGQNLFKWAVTDGNPLTRQPSWKDTTPFLPEYHTAVLPANMTVRLKYKAYFEDGTDQTVSTSKTYQGIQYDVIRFPAGYEQLGLDQLSQQVTKWEVWLINDSDQSEVGEHTSYRLDPWDCSPMPRYFLWEGSLGGWHSLRSKGERSRNANISSTQVERLIPVGSLQQVRQQYRTEYEQVYEQYSGYLPNGHADWLLDLMISEDVYITQDFGYLRERIAIDRGSFTVNQDNDFLERISFNYRDATGAHRGL